MRMQCGREVLCSSCPWMYPATPAIEGFESLEGWTWIRQDAETGKPRYPGKYVYKYIYTYTTCFLFLNKFRIGLPENVWLLFSFVWVQWMRTCHCGPNIYRKHNMNFAPICCIPPTNPLKILGLVLGRVHSLYCLFRATSRGTVTGDR